MQVMILIVGVLASFSIDPKCPPSANWPLVFLAVICFACVSYIQVNK